MRVGTKVMLMDGHMYQFQEGRVSQRVETCLGYMWRIELESGRVTLARDEQLQEVAG